MLAGTFLHSKQMGSFLGASRVRGKRSDRFSQLMQGEQKFQPNLRSLPVMPLSLGPWFLPQGTIKLKGTSCQSTILGQWSTRGFPSPRHLTLCHSAFIPVAGMDYSDKCDLREKGLVFAHSSKYSLLWSGSQVSRTLMKLSNHNHSKRGEGECKYFYIVQHLWLKNNTTHNQISFPTSIVIIKIFLPPLYTLGQSPLSQMVLDPVQVTVGSNHHAYPMASCSAPSELLPRLCQDTEN